MSTPSTDTSSASAAFQIVLESHLKQLDTAYDKLRKLHADPDVLNDSCKSIREAREEFGDASDRIFRLKNVMHEALEANA